MKKYELYVCDIETTGLTVDHDVIELSLYRLSNDEQRTWCIKPIRNDNIEMDALRINGHNLDDILHNTKEGKTRYLPAHNVIAQIENWLMDDFHSTEERLLVGHNVSGFDKERIIALWNKCNSRETFPFNKKYAIDTMLIQVFLDVAGITEQSEYYNLSSLVQKYGIRKEKAHSAADDTRMCKNVFLEQLNTIKKLMNK